MRVVVSSIKNCNHQWVRIGKLMLGCRYCGKTQKTKEFMLDKKRLANNWN